MSAAFPQSLSNAGGGALPSSEELVSLLQKQDNVISELFQELALCKQEVSAVKSESLSASRENKKLFEQLKSLILDNVAASPLNSARKDCGEKCRQSEKAAAPLTITELEREAVEKVREAVSLVEQSEAEKAELRTRLRLAEERVETFQFELNAARNKFNHDLSLCQDSTHAECKEELSLSKEEVSKLRNQLAIAQSELASSAEKVKEASDAKQEVIRRSEKTETQLRNEISTLRTELTEQKIKVARLELEKQETEQSLGLELGNKSRQQEITTEALAELKNLFSEAKKHSGEAKEECLNLSRRNGDLENELLKCKSELRKQAEDFYSERRENSLRINALNDSVSRKESDEKRDAIRIVENQKKLIESLRSECQRLAEEMLRKGKEYKQEIKQLRRDKADLSSRLESLLSASDISQ